MTGAQADAQAGVQAAPAAEEKAPAPAPEKELTPEEEKCAAFRRTLAALPDDAGRVAAIGAALRAEEGARRGAEARLATANEVHRTRLEIEEAAGLGHLLLVHAGRAVQPGLVLAAALYVRADVPHELLRRRRSAHHAAVL